MKSLQLQLYFLVFLRLVIHKSSGVFYDCEDTKHLSLFSVMHLLDRVYPGCHQVNLTREFVVCEVNTPQDLMALTGGSTTCGQPACPDGTSNKTCYPVASTRSGHQYECICKSVMKPEMLEDDTYWGNWQADIWRDYVEKRQLLIGTPPTCIMEEYLKDDIVFIISTAFFEDPDLLYNASSEYGVQHEAYRARFDEYQDFSCIWAAHEDDLAPWLQISLPEDSMYLIRGVAIRERCDAPYVGRRPNVINVTTSSDDIDWQDVLVYEDITNSYTDGETSVFFYPPSTNKYWRIHIVEFTGERGMQCDLIGNELKP